MTIQPNEEMSAERKCRCGGVVTSAKHALKEEWFAYCVECGRESPPWRSSEKEALDAYDYYEDHPNNPKPIRLWVEARECER